MISFNLDALFLILGGRQRRGVQTQAKSWVASVKYYHNNLGGETTACCGPDTCLYTIYYQNRIFRKH
ncbi:MAG: hypothetical protein WAL79_11390, partial [Nitrososphaeraceae archaeon]